MPISIEGSSLADFVIENGTSGNWNYRRWFSGRVEAWNNFAQSKDTITYSSHTTSGTIYRWIGRAALPTGLFKSVKYSVVSGTGGIGWWNGSQSTAALTTNSIEVIFFSNSSSYNETT